MTDVTVILCTHGRTAELRAALDALATAVAAEPAPPVLDLSECVRELKRLRYDREQAALQREIDRLQELGAAEHGAEINALWARKHELLQRIAGLI